MNCNVDGDDRVKSCSAPVTRVTPVSLLSQKPAVTATAGAWNTGSAVRGQAAEWTALRKAVFLGRVSDTSARSPAAPQKCLCTRLGSCRPPETCVDEACGRASSPSLTPGSSQLPSVGGDTHLAGAGASSAGAAGSQRHGPGARSQAPGRGLGGSAPGAEHGPVVPGEGWRTAEGPGTTGDGSSVCCAAARRDSTLVTRQASPSEEWSFRVCDHSTHAPPYTHVPTYTHPHKAPMNPHAHTRTQTDANPDAHGHVNQDVADHIEMEGRGRRGCRQTETARDRLPRALLGEGESVQVCLPCTRGDPEVDVGLGCLVIGHGAAGQHERKPEGTLGFRVRDAHEAWARASPGVCTGG